MTMRNPLLIATKSDHFDKRVKHKIEKFVTKFLRGRKESARNSKNVALCSPHSEEASVTYRDVSMMRRFVNLNVTCCNYVPPNRFYLAILVIICRSYVTTSFNFVHFRKNNLSDEKIQIKPDLRKKFGQFCLQNS